MMKKRILSLAVTAGLIGAAATAQAQMHVNDKGLGEALIYPFYSAANGNDTYIHLVNTTDAVKAVKVRFIEGMNSQEVLDFNLYLSPEDVWAAVITATDDGGAKIRTVDTTCSVPMLGSQGAGSITNVNGNVQRDQPFVGSLYQLDGEDFRGLDRTQEGYVEVIEMGQMVNDGADPNLPAMAIHTNDGVPANCDGLVAAWSTGGAWKTDASTDFQTWDNNGDGGSAGGLYGFGVVINVPEGTASGYDAVAIDDFVLEGDPDLHREPGDELPNLENGQQAVAIFDGPTVTTHVFNQSIDAVSSLLMSSHLMNDYVVDPAINARTDWVVTMPTKRFYVQGDPADLFDEVQAPFHIEWNPEFAEACEPVAFKVWDREEKFEEIIDGPVFSPAPETVLEDNALCREVNVITFGEDAGDSALKASDNIRVNVDPGYDEGWARLSFLPGDLNTTMNPLDRTLTANSGAVFNGLPVTGFATFSYENGDVGGVLSNYGADSEHKTAIDVTPAPALQ